LDVGCGLGFFSQRLVQRGGDVVASDIGPTLVDKTRQRAGCEAVVADAMRLVEHFGPDSFDGVVSSECIEHVPEPRVAVEQMVRVVKPGGFLSLSTPNRLWQPVVRAATVLRLRPFDGHENFSTWRSLRDTLRSAGVAIERERGLHLFPFQIPLHRLSMWCDQHWQCVRGLMVNICVLGRKLNAEG
jgi:2-polyprenyl-6-hydroxyphenyl methylase/3-demethylubiquinone-9 3-methyltransferase